MDEPGTESTSTEDQRQTLVVIGSSAGGIDAVLTVIGRLPADFPAPIIVAQHLDPHHQSHLADLLASRSTLPVRTVTDEEDIQRGTVYVVPANRDVEVANHRIALIEKAAGRSQPSVDRLMSSAARAFREDVIGVILTGSGSDGAVGAQAIKAHGGTVIVQNPESARYSDMPASIPRAAVDIVAELEAIGGLLVDLCSGDAALPSPGEDGAMRAFLERVRDQTGLDFASYKQQTINRRLQRRMLAVGASTLRDYQRHVERHPDEMQRLVTSFLIKVTRFFRDTALFDYLRDRVLPGLLEEARERGELRIWSAGCATGEEAYSLAMLLSDLLDKEAERVSIRIFATDVAPDAVDFARHGVFPAAAVDELPSDMVERHFLHIDGAYEVRKSVRSMVIFGEHDLSRRAPFPRIDLALCRNVLIYFTPELQRRALQLFAFSLRLGGYLALGKAESVSPLPEYFALEESRLKVFRRVGGEAPMPAGRVLGAMQSRNNEGTQAVQAARGSSRDAQGTERRQRVARQSSQIMDRMSVGIITVEPNYHIRSINVAARTLLNIHAAALGEDLIHQVPPDLSRPLRSVVDAAYRGEMTTSTLRMDTDVVEDGGRDFVITCAPVLQDHDDDHIDIVVLEIVDITTFSRERRDLTRERDDLRETRDQLQGRVSAAVGEIRHLRAAGQEMAIQQGRLRAENEQLQVASEEAQAATEEIETLNEEQQAANEELETLNEELQATVEELNTTNADLQARTIELESLATRHEQQRRDSEEQRVRLHAMMSNMGDAVLMLDSSGDVLLTNPAWDSLLGPPEDLVPESETGQPLPASAWSLRRIVEDDAFTIEFTLPHADGARRWFEASSQPIPGDGESAGMVVVRDITERSLRRLQERFLAVASHELRTPMTTLSGSIQLMKRRLSRAQEGDEMLERHVDRAQGQIRRLELLIAELTDIARLRGGMFQVELVTIDLRQVVREAVDIAGDLAGEIELRIDTPDEPVRVSGDPSKLEQVLLNLILNAFRHAIHSEHVDVRLRREADTAVVDVQDYGPGISVQAMSEIFTQFHQARGDTQSQGGLGLGLFIAREIVTAHGGTIDARSVIGEGATFEIRLPMVPEGHPGTDPLPAADSFNEERR